MDFAEATVIEPVAPVGELDPLAPWQHTIVVMVAVAGLAFIAHLARTPATVGRSHVPNYLSHIMMIWMILGSVTAGIYHRRLFFFNTLERNRVSWLLEAVRGAATYVALLVVLGIAVVATGFPSHVREMQHASETGEDQTELAERVQKETQQKLHLDNRVVRASAPSTGWELLLWLGVSITAGFCEEHVFRGYLLRQGIAWMSRTKLPRWAGIGLAIVASSLLFGSLHAYEGAGGALFIAVLGASYCLVALRFRNLRAVIVAHTLQDFTAGLFLWARHH